METLRDLNRRGVLRGQSEHGWRGFSVHGRSLPGLAKTLRRYRLGGDTIQRHSEFAPGPGSQCRLLRSNKSIGAVAHAAIATALEQGIVPPAHNYASACARGAALFCAGAGLRLEAAELVITHPELPVATRFDALCRDSQSGALELLSWKTGCGPRNGAEQRQHEAQLAMEWRMLEQGHGVAVRRATLLYVGAIQHIRTRKMAHVYKGYELSRAHAEQLIACVEKHLAAKKAKPKKKGREKAKPKKKGRKK